MENATHKVTVFENVNQDDPFLRIIILKENAEKVEELIAQAFEREVFDPERFLKLMEVCVDFGFISLADIIKASIKEVSPASWEMYLAGQKSDMSSADGSDNR